MDGSKRCITACFTGHRPNQFGGYDEDSPTSKAPITRKLLRKEIDRLIAEYDEVEFIVGGALGVDTWAALEALESRKNNANVKVTLAIPHVGQQNKWPPTSQYRWLGIFRFADKVYFCDQGEYAPYKMMNRNKWMVDQSDLVIAVWNGEPTGGTANCVAYATKKQKDVINLWPEIQKLLP